MSAVMKRAAFTSLRYDQAQIHPKAPLAEKTSEMELLERDRSLADLAEWYSAAQQDAGLIVMVSGEAGIGKTSLVQEFTKRHCDPARVLWGACDSLFTPQPLTPLYDISRQTKGKLLSAVEADAGRDVLFSAALDEITQMDAPVVVFEDMHWADEATLDLLKFLGRRIQWTRAMLILTYREDEVGVKHPLRYLTGDLPSPRIRRLRLIPLSETAVTELAHRANRSAAGLYAATDGNPFFVTEILAAETAQVPSTVRDAVLARAARLPAESRRIAEFVCIVPGKAEPWLLEQAMQVDEGGIEGCLSIGMRRDEEGALAFRHELARRALEDSLSPRMQQELHCRVLSVLKQRPGVSPARLAHHAAGARQSSDVLQFAQLAADKAASVGSHREAVALYRLALRYAQDLEAPGRARLLEQLSFECYLTDQLENALEARSAAHDIWRDAGIAAKRGDALRWMSRINWFLGRSEAAGRFADEAIAALETLPPSAELAMAYSNRAQLDMLRRRSADAISWSQRAIALAETTHSDEALCHALNNLGVARNQLGEDGWPDVERSLALALEHRFHDHAARAYTNLLHQALSMRRFETGLAYLRTALEYMEKHDLDSYRLYALGCRAHALLRRGEWDEAGDDAEAVLRHMRSSPISRILPLTVLGHLRVRRGDPDARAPLDEAYALAAPTQELQRVAPIAAAYADLAWLTDDQGLLIDFVLPAYKKALSEHEPWVAGELGLALWRTGILKQRPKGGLAEPYALEIAGNWRSAADAWNALGCPYEAACALASSGRECEMLQALELLEQLGASGATVALRKRMRAQGLRRIPRGARASTRNNSHGLTRRQAEILECLSQGLRNAAIAKRLFLSTKTVDHHVSAILTKLGVASRAEAVAAARKLAADEPSSP